MDKHVYQVNIKWLEDRCGILSAPGINEKVKIATPEPFDGGVSNIFSPEHLYAGSIASCLMTTFIAIAKNSNFNFTSFECNAEGILERPEGKYRMTKVTLNVRLGILDEKDSDKALRILKKSEQVCLISNSVTAEIELNIDIITS